MSLDVIFPNESKMKVDDLDKLRSKLVKLKKSKVPNEILESMIKYLGETQGILLVADRKNIVDYFEKFIKIKFLDVFNEYLELENENINFYILQMINFISTNIKNQELLDYLLSQMYKTKIPGVEMNLIDKLVCLDTKKNEEFLTYQINFMKSLTLKINIDSIKYFYNKNINQFPILTKSFSLYNHSDPLIRNVVKNIFLAIVKIEDKDLREFLTAFPINLYYTNIVYKLKNSIINLCKIIMKGKEIKENISQFRKEHDFIVDTIIYLSDILDLKIENINFILINCLLNEIILPTMASIENNDVNQDFMTIYNSLYLLGLFLFSCKNEFIHDVITYFLFKNKISKELYEKLSKTKLIFTENNVMNDINNIITNSQFADVNDPNWQRISGIMKKSNGIDLSSSEIDFENIYELMKNLMNINNKDDINNPIYELINIYFKCNDDSIILNLNLIVNCCLNYNKDKKSDNNDMHNILNFKFFKINLDNNDSEDVFNYLFSFLNSSKCYRLATNEIILYNIQLFAQICTKENNDNQENKQKIGNKLLNLFNNQMTQMNELIENNIETNKHIFDSCLKAYEYYVKNLEKKLNDLFTLSSILIPVIYLDLFDDIPIPLRSDKLNKDFLINYIFKIFYLNDIINELYGQTKEIIKNKKFPLEIDTFKLSIGKTYEENDLGDDYVHCKILRDDNFILCQAIFSADTLYYGEVMSGSFDDLSKIKIFKKIPMRYLDFKNGDNECTLNVYDKSTPATAKKSIIMHCINKSNTKTMFNYMLQLKCSCNSLERSLFDSFIEEIKNRLKNLISE